MNSLPQWNVPGHCKSVKTTPCTMCPHPIWNIAGMLQLIHQKKKNPSLCKQTSFEAVREQLCPKLFISLIIIQLQRNKHWQRASYGMRSVNAAEGVFNRRLSIAKSSFSPSWLVPSQNQTEENAHNKQHGDTNVNELSVWVLQQTPERARSQNWPLAVTWLLGCNDLKISNLTGLADNNCWGGGRVRWMNRRHLQDDAKVSDNDRREPRVILFFFCLV